MDTPDTCQWSPGRRSYVGGVAAHLSPSRRNLAGALAVGVSLGMMAAGCGSGSNPGGSPPTRSQPRVSDSYHIDLPQVEARPGTAVVILVDTSGSMGHPVPDRAGQIRAKHLIAKDALQRIVEHTAKWRKEHPDAALQLGIYNFSSGVTEVLPMGDFDETKAEQALVRIPNPNGGTAIGRALEAGAKALYRSGCTRKFILCITDGENTSGPAPDRVARQLFNQTGGDVAMEFVAFDTSASHFKFLKEVKGNAVEASSGEQLREELGKIYRSKVLAEAPEQPQ